MIRLAQRAHLESISQSIGEDFGSDFITTIDANMLFDIGPHTDVDHVGQQVLSLGMYTHHLIHHTAPSKMALAPERHLAHILWCAPSLMN